MKNVLIISILVLLFIQQLHSGFIYPNGGNNGIKWYQNSNQIISWNSDLFKSDSFGVKIYLFNGENSSKSFIAEVDSGVYSYTWSIPSNQETGKLFKIIVESSIDSTFYLSSKEFFSIYPESQQPKKLNVENKNGNDELMFSLYPNPTSEYLTIDTKSSLIKHLKVFDLMGNIIVEKNNISDTKYTFSVKSISKGSYLLSLTIDNNCIVTRMFFVK